jgi:hypothetical protein
MLTVEIFLKYTTSGRKEVNHDTETILKCTKTSSSIAFLDKYVQSE